MSNLKSEYPEFLNMLYSLHANIERFWLLQIQVSRPKAINILVQMNYKHTHGSTSHRKQYIHSLYIYIYAFSCQCAFRRLLGAFGSCSTRALQ